MKIDGSGNTFIESEMLNINQAVRVSFIEEGWTDGNCIRINIRDENNHIRRGAEIPIENVSEVMILIQTLKMRNRNIVVRVLNRFMIYLNRAFYLLVH